MEFPFRRCRSLRYPSKRFGRLEWKPSRAPVPISNMAGIGVVCSPNGKPYVLRAEFEAKGSEGAVEKGLYEDTCLSDGPWRREASFGKSRVVRSRNGEKRYQIAEGPDAGVVQFVLKAMEPIPATDTFVESDWRIKR